MERFKSQPGLQGHIVTFHDGKYPFHHENPEVHEQIESDESEENFVRLCEKESDLFIDTTDGLVKNQAFPENQLANTVNLKYVYGAEPTFLSENSPNQYQSEHVSMEKPKMSYSQLISETLMILLPKCQCQ